MQTINPAPVIAITETTRVRVNTKHRAFGVRRGCRPIYAGIREFDGKWRLWPILWALALVAVTGCIAEPNGAHGPLRVSSEFTEAQRADVALAVDEWHTATDGGIDLEIDVRNDRDGRAWSVRPEALNPHQVGATFQAQIAVDTAQLAALGAPAEAFRAVVLHELGHAAGLKHADAGLMQPNSAGVSACVDEATLRTMCAQISCGPAAHATCK